MLIKLNHLQGQLGSVKIGFFSIYHLKHSQTLPQTKYHQKMSYTVLHTQRYLYPCQLSAINHDKTGNSQQHTRKSSFSFYSPLQSHMSVYDVSREEHELIDLQGRRFMSMQGVDYSGGCQCRGSVILSNDEQIMIVGESQSGSQVLVKQSVGGMYEIISNAIVISGQSVQSLQKKKLAYMTRNEATGLTELRVQGFDALDLCAEYDQVEGDVESQYREGALISSSKSIDSRIRSGDSITNPQDGTKSFKSINCYDENYSCPSTPSLKCISNNHQCHPMQSTNKPSSCLALSSRRIQLSCLSSQHSRQATFRLYHSSQHSSQSQLFILDKQASIINLFDLQYGVVTDAIGCCGSQDGVNVNPHILHSEGRKLSIMGDNLILQYDSMGVVKIVDKRVGRVVQVRNMNEQLAGLGNNVGQHSFQQRFVKFWSSQHQHTQHQNLSHSTEFMINFHNKILNIDLRYKLHSLNYSQLFSADSDQILGNYHISKQKGSNVIGFTTENHNSFKSYVVRENQ